MLFMKYYNVLIHTSSGKFIVMNTDEDGCIPTLTTAHHYAGNIIAPRQGFRESGVLYIYETD